MRYAAHTKYTNGIWPPTFFWGTQHMHKEYVVTKPSPLLRRACERG